MNFLLNVVEVVGDVSSGEGRISVGLEKVHERDSGSIRIVIEDNGAGIPVHELTKIFYPFFTTKSHGTGLGLSLVQKIVLAHNGRVDVQCTEGKGARFTAIFPSL